MKRLLLTLIVAAAAAGCKQGGQFSSVPGSDAEGYATVAESLDQYAEKQGISREEAIRELRQKADGYQPAAAGRSLAEQGSRFDSRYPVQPAAAYQTDPGPPNPLTLQR